jgi:hypothetical protein
VRCDLISACPAGSARQFTLIGILVLAVIDLALVASTFGPFLLQRLRIWIVPHYPLQDTEAENGAFKESSVEPAGTKLHDLERFVQSLARCIGLDEAGLEIGFDRLGLQLSEGQKTILNGVTGKVQRGSLLAVMGSSGAGKCKDALA